MSGHALRNLAFILAGLAIIVFGVRIALGRAFSTGGAPADARQKSAVSRDGTVIAYEETGAGPVLILVSAALTDRDGTRPLARQLASAFTVVNYDRRGRGLSTNTEPYAIERELEDLEALVAAAGQPVFLFGSSSGAVLALDAANRIGTGVRMLYLYEPPLLVDNSRPPMPDTLIQEIHASLAADDRNEAVSLFFRKGMGIPAPGVVFMRLLLPAWSGMTRIAHTAPYDLMLLAGTQSGQPLPAARWNSIAAPAMVAVGAKSEPFFHSGANALTALLRVARYQSLKGLDHSAVLMAPQPLAKAIRSFFLTGSP